MKLSGVVPTSRWGGTPRPCACRRDPSLGIVVAPALVRLVLCHDVELTYSRLARSAVAAAVIGGERGCGSAGKAVEGRVWAASRAGLAGAS